MQEKALTKVKRTSLQQTAKVQQTFCPIDKKPIIKEMLLPEEMEWLNNYHQHVFEVLSHRLDEGEMEWLQEACTPL